MQAILLIAIVISGSLFMHKHKTSTGEIVIHNHPYNFKNDPDKVPQHKSDDEIHFLDVVFHGTFIQLDSFEFNFNYFTKYYKEYPHSAVFKIAQFFNADYFLRGPPQNLI